MPWLIVLLGSATGLASFAEGLEKYSGVLMGFGLVSMSVGLFQYWKKKQQKMSTNQVILFSTISCPSCNFQKEEEMPTNACQYFYECEQCKIIIQPKANDCCVYCSYGTVACPPIQLNQDCCN